MPCYEYICDCSFKEERLESIYSKECHDCPNCGKLDGAKRIISGTSFILSGSCWEKDNYK